VVLIFAVSRFWSPSYRRVFFEKMTIGGMKRKLSEVSAGDEHVLHAGFDGKVHEYCPYNETSKTYDVQRAPLGVNVMLGALAQGDVELKKQRVLDIGCGTGTFIRAIMGKVRSVSGMDYNDGMLKQAYENLGQKVSLSQGSADNLTFATETFDACSMNQVLHHFPKDDDYSFVKKAFEEAFRVLKTGGVFHVNTSSPEQQRDGFWWLSLFPEATEKMMARFPPLHIVKKYLVAAGFNVDCDSLTVPIERSLMAEHKYLEHGVSGAFDSTYRSGDSSWAMAENCGELEMGQKKLKEMLDMGTADRWLAQREMLRKTVGQATFITVRKPHSSPGSPHSSPSSDQENAVA